MTRTFALFFACAFTASLASTATVHQALFSPRQLFWPGLTGPPAPGKAGAGKAAAPGPLRIAVLPVRLTDYGETKPCDSCHRLSANGMEFFLENYLKDRMQTRFPKAEVELVAPHHSLLEAGKINLTAALDSLIFPWDKWFDGYAEPLIYRPKDRMTPEATRRRLDRLGGILGASHLLIPARMRVLVKPLASDTHSGGLEWGFSLVFWNVTESRPEWALAFSENVPQMDLDHSLDPHLDRSLLAAWERMPSDLAALWKAEPR